MKMSAIKKQKKNIVYMYTYLITPPLDNVTDKNDVH